MSTRVRKLMLTAHVTVSVGWLGAVLAYLALAITGLEATDPHVARGTYAAMAIVLRLVIIPLCLATVTTGGVQSLATQWGLFRHYWILTKFVLTVAATTILLVHAPAVQRMAELAAQTQLGIEDHRRLRTQLVIHAGGGLCVLLFTTVLSVFKPWGLTPYGRRERPTWTTKQYAMFGIVALALAFVVWHLAAGGPRHH